MDKYQYPKHICDSVEDLAELTNTTPGTIRISALRWKKGQLANPHFVSIDISESEYIEIMEGINNE